VRTNKALARIVMVLGAALLALGTAITAFTSTASAQTHAHSAAVRYAAPATDGGCATDYLHAVQLCFHFYGGRTSNEAIGSIENLTTGTATNVHIEITGPKGSFNSPTWNIGAHQSRTYSVCPSECYWNPGTYEAILWQYYGNWSWPYYSYHKIAHYSATVS
jgi:hypothetical protein